MYIRLSDGEDYCADCTIRYREGDGCCSYLEWGPKFVQLFKMEGQ